MYHKNFWFGVNGLIFLLVIFSYVTKIQGNGEDDTNNNDDTTDDPTDDNNAYYSTSTVTGTTKKYVKKYSGKKSYDTYGQDYAGYDDNYGGYGSSVNKGIDPDTYGQDMADDGEIYEDKDSMAGSLNLWIRSAHRWDEPDKKRYRGGKYDKKRYGKDSKKKYSKTGSYKGQDYKEDDDYDKNERYDGDSKYEKVTFPVRYYKDYKKFPIRRFPPLFSTFPWSPVFYDKITYQTFVVSPAGGIIVMPPLINFFGQRFAVAQLIKWGYASLVSGVLPPPAGFDVAPLVQPAGAPGAPAAPSLPYNPQNGQFNGGVTTGYGSFKPRGY